MFEENELELESGSQVSISDYLKIIYRRRWLIIITFLIIFGITCFVTFTTEPEYEASTTIMIKSTGAMERTLFEFDYMGGQTTLISNQIEILKSRTLAERVIKSLNLSDVRDSLNLFKPNEKGEYLSMRGMISVIRGNMDVNHRKDTDIITLTYTSNSAFEAAFIANTIAEEFRSLNAEENSGELYELRSFVERQLEKKSEELKLSEDKLREFQEKEKLTSLDKNTSELVNTLSGYEAKLEQAQIELRSNLELKKSLEQQLNERKETLSADLSEISSGYLLSLQSQLAQAEAEKTKYMMAIQSEVQDASKQHFESRLKVYDERIIALRDKLDEEAKKISSSNMVSDPFQLSQQLLTQYLEVDSKIKAGTATINALQEVVSEYGGRLNFLPEKTLELARLERKRKVDEETYVMLTQKLEETKIQAAAQSRNVHVIDQAIEPMAAVRPKTNMNIMLGVLIGLGLGIGLVFLMEYFDNSVKTSEELEAMGFNLLASIPKIEMDKYEEKLESKLEKLGPIEGKRIEARLITHLDPKSPVAEAYRTLRTNLQFSKIDRQLKTILVTSSGPKEGKSTTAANLAIAMAQVGNKVVLVDADLRRPVIHSIFGIDKEDGVTNYLMGKNNFEQTIKSTFHENLFIFTSGILPPNPSELLASQKMEQLLHKLNENFDTIILDSPPVIAVTDAAVLSTKVDGTILVVSSGQTNKDALGKAFNLLNSVNSKLLGVLLNGVDVKGLYGSYDYYYYHHYYTKPGKGMKRLKFLNQSPV